MAGDGLIENIFIDQRDHDGGTGSDVGGIWTYSDRHHGHIQCRHNFIAGVGNNACYDAGDGWAHMESTGTVGHEYCYHRDNTPSNFRPGKTDSYVRNCVAIANDPTGKRGGYPANDSQLTRACWAWHNPDIRMENCAIWWDPDDVAPSSPFWATVRDGSESTTCSLRVVDSNINASWDDSLTYGGGDVIFENLGHEPSIDVLGEGVPVTPEMAARGERALPPEVGTAPGGGHGETTATEPEPDPEPTDEWSYESASGVHTDLPYELVIEHTDPGERVTYEVEFEGSVEVGEWEYNATLDGRVATGGVGPETGLDNIYFDGGILRFDVTNADHARFLLADAQDREVVSELDPADFPGETTDEEDPLAYEDADGVHTDLPREFVVELVESGERVTYELEVDGQLEAGEFGGPPAIDGGVAQGGVGPDTDIDNVYFDGEITGFSGDGLERARIFIAEAQTRRILAEYDPTQFPENVNTYTYAFAHGNHTNLAHELVVELTNPGERVTYEIEIDGQAEAGEFAYPPTVDGTVATGGLGPARGIDNLYFDGEITRIDGEQLDRVRIYRADPVTRSIETELDPADFAPSPPDEHAIRLEPSGDGGSYDITVSEDIRDDPAVAFDATGNISGRNAEGAVSDRTHGYVFEGDLTDVTLQGDVDLQVDGTPVDQDAGGETVVLIDGSPGEDVARYRFEVSESVEFADDVSSGTYGFWDLPRDHVDEGTVVGLVHERTDAYRFAGEIVSLQVNGAADVDFVRD